MIGSFLYSHYLNWDGSLSANAFKPGAFLWRWQLYRLEGEIKSLIEHERTVAYMQGYRDASGGSGGV